jgi:hypothetical protein
MYQTGAMKIFSGAGMVFVMCHLAQMWTMKTLLRSTTQGCRNGPCHVSLVIIVVTPQVCLYGHCCVLPVPYVDNVPPPPSRYFLAFNYG